MKEVKGFKIRHNCGHITLKIPGERDIIIERPWHQTKVFSLDGKEYEFEPDEWMPRAGKVEIPGYIITLWYEHDEMCGKCEKYDRRLKPEHR